MNTDIMTLETLEVDALPRDCVRRVQLMLLHDGLGQPMRLPLLVARGRRPGPVAGITAAVHGNELNGIPVIHRFFEQLDTHKLRGTVVGVCAVNLPGLHLHQRELSDGTDLNHIFPGRADGNAAQVYAHRVVEQVVKKLDVLLDLHTASFGRVNSLYVRADMTHATTARMAYLQRPQIIVHNPASDGTLRGTAMALGIPAITVEIGDPSRFQPRYIRSTLAGVRAVLADAGCLPKRKVAPGSAPVVCERSHWIFTDRGGLLNVLPKTTERVVEGDVIARLRDIYGSVVREYRAPEAGIVVGHSVNPVGPTGARILHLGIEATPAIAEEFIDHADLPEVPDDADGTTA